MRITSVIRFLVFSFLFMTACEVPADLSSNYPFPPDNTPNKEKIALGRSLFFDKRLSIDGSIACADCHRPEFAFTDRLSTSKGVNNQRAERNAPSILNSAFLQTIMFDAHLKTLELQVIVPIQEPTEMGHNMKQLIAFLKQDKYYQNAAKELFNREFDAWVLTRSIAAFERSLLSLNSPYDRYMKGHKKAMNSEQIEGMKLFNSLYCVNCHPAPYFTNFKAENNGLYLDYGKDKGRFRINLDSADIGFFKTPSLRNIALTYPYMHDGSLNTLEDVLNHYISGGKKPKGQNRHIQALNLKEKQKKQLISFLMALTDTTYMKKIKANAH